MVAEVSGKENKSMSLPIKFVQKGWGHERWIVNCEEYCGKLLFFDKEMVLNPGENFHVYRGLRHRMIAIEDSELFEFSTEHFDSDSYRVEKGD